MNLLYLSKVGATYGAEESWPNDDVRMELLNRLSTKLKAKITDRNTARESLAKFQSQLNGTSPSLPLRGMDFQGARRLQNEAIERQKMANLSPKEKFEKERSLKSDLAKAEANVQHQTAWIERQDAKVNPEGSIDWTVSHRRVLYDRDPALQQLTQLHFNGTGKIYTDAACTKPFDTTNMVTHISGPGKAIYVMTEKGSLHASSHSVGHRHHSSLLAGIETAGAGELEVKAGVLKWISNKSGHYCPNLKHFLQVLHVLERKGKISNSFKIMYFPTKQEFANTAAFQGQMIAADEDWDYEFNKLMLYHQHLTDVILATHTPNAWRWRNPDEAPGVYDVVTNTLVPHRDVRSWLKGKGHGMRPDVQKGTGR